MKRFVKLFVVLLLAGLIAVSVPACSAGGETNGNNNNGNQTDLRLEQIEKQVFDTKGTVQDIYDRGVRKGGLFAVSDSDVAATGTELFAADNDESEKNAQDLLAELISLLDGHLTYGLSSQPLLKSYVLDVFAYTQVSFHILNEEKELALSKIHEVSFERDAEFNSNMSINGWMPMMPKEMSIAGYDEDTGIANILFKAYEHRVGATRYYETVNSQLFYHNDNDFGYAQFTTRYNHSNEYYELGFNYFDMKSKLMFEVNKSASGDFFGTNYGDKRETANSLIQQIEDAFNAQTFRLEQSNLNLADELGLLDEQAAQTPYVKYKSDKILPVTFDYELLQKLIGV